MTTSPNPLRSARPRRLLVFAGLAAVALAVVRDRDLVHLRELNRVEQHIVDTEHGAERPLRRLSAAMRAHEEGAGTRFSDAFETWVMTSFPPNDDPLATQEVVTGPEHPAWAPYWKLREAAHPEYRASLERVAAEALRLHADMPDNGAFEAIAGLIEVELATSPFHGEPLALGVNDPDAMVDWVRVEDPARLARGLELIDKALARPTLFFINPDDLAAMIDPIQGAPIERFCDRVAVSITVLKPELMFLRSHLEHLVLLARKQQRLGGSGDALLSRARKLALRHGAESMHLIDLLVAVSNLGQVDAGWLRDATARGDVAVAVAASKEQAATMKRREAARHMSGNYSIERLGAIDSMFMPAGGWHGPAFDPHLGRRFDHAFVESAILLALLAVGLIGLAVAWLQSRTSVPAGAPPAAGWTLGDLLGVVLPSFGGVAVLTLVHTRLHPARTFSLFRSFDVAFVQAGTFLLLAGFLFCWLLRRAVLAKHGLAFARPTAAWLGLGLVLLGAHLSLDWTSGAEQALLAPAGLLMLSGIFASWRGAALGRASATDPIAARAVRGYEGRVGLACLGVALALVAGLEVVAVSPRRDQLVRDYEAQWIELMNHEASHWGAGEPQKHLRELLETAPDAPPPER